MLGNGFACENYHNNYPHYHPSMQPWLALLQDYHPPVASTGWAGQAGQRAVEEAGFGGEEG